MAHTTARRSRFSLFLGRRGIPAHLLATHCGVSVSAVHKWMLGERKPSKALRAVIAKTAGVRMATVDTWFRS